MLKTDMNTRMPFTPLPSAVQVPIVDLKGLLGDALAANYKGRLSRFITDENSPAISIFSPEQISRSLEGDWYGEHAGKWLYAASKAAQRTGDLQLAQSVQRVADYLVGRQDVDGYLGTYPPERRFMQQQPPAPRSWNGAPLHRTWDIWIHACMTLGLLEVHKRWPQERYLRAAAAIGDLFWHSMTEGGINIAELGLHHGLSATVMLDAAVELHVMTGNAKYHDLALLILKQANERPDLELLPQLLAGIDVADISTGKAYQLCWNMVGLAKLHRVTGDGTYLRAIEDGWNSIRQNHLTLGGGPWGGIGQRSREVFNHAGIFSPEGYVETCSTLSWLQLNRELLAITGEAKYAQEIERAAYNDLLGAMAPNGEDWCYYSFPNGRRVFTTYWRCCKSSGAMALEELPGVAYQARSSDELTVNLYGPSSASFSTSAAGTVVLEQYTNYPFDGDVRIVVKPARAGAFCIRVRIPDWAHNAEVAVNASPCGQSAVAGSYVLVERCWQEGEEITLKFPMSAQLHHASSRSVQESKDPEGNPVEQEVMHYDYVAITRGPLVYASTLIDGFKTHETLRLPDSKETPLLELEGTPEGYRGPTIRMNLGYREALRFQPYFEAGGRVHGTWRLTWMQVAPADGQAPGK
jgi:DUF1680 family protein